MNNSIYLSKHSNLNLQVIEELKDIQKPATASLITNDEEINSHELANLKISLEKLNIQFVHIYSNNRETVLCGKSLKIISNKCLKERDIILKVTVRLGNKISSNDDFFIVDDINPGAIVSANNNVYVWGKL